VPPAGSGADAGADADAALEGGASADAAVDASPVPSDAAGLDGAPDGAAEAGPPPPPRCDPSYVWTPVGRLVSVPSAGFARFDGVSADELSIAWTSTTGDLYVADRAARDGPFGPAVAVPLSGVADPGGRAALSANGTSVIAVAADKSGFVSLRRPAAGSPWAVDPSLPFAAVNANPSEGALQFSDPVLGDGDRALFFLSGTLGQVLSLHESRWDPVQRGWTAGSPLTTAQLVSSGPPRRPTGASSDGRTLFYVDEAMGVARGAWRDALSAPFGSFVDLPGLTEAAPNARCDTLYYQGSDSAGLGVFLAQ
jgi:hypothetical protein